MADETSLLEPYTMKELDKDVLICDSCDSISSNNNDKGFTLDPDRVEDRFRVDRKKLELMLPLDGQNEDENADEFFQRIMDDTNTQITWPSKLKVGARSKKDPHIKVTGRLDDVKAARDRIMTVLDTKSNRLTLKMDVSHTEHSHVIGKGGNNIKRVMQETGCHIHFPDSNRGNNVQEKSNQVSIAGQPCGVENARLQIRGLLPLVLLIELPTNGCVVATPDASSPFLQHIQQAYGVSVTFRQRTNTYSVTVAVRGSVCSCKKVKEATSAIVEHLTGGTLTTVQVSVQLEVATQHHMFMIGRSGANVKQIMQQTGATIHFPDPNTVTPQRKGTVYLTGSIDSVLLARQQLIGCLPLVLMFDVKEGCDVNQAKVAQLMEQLDVFISIKPKPKQTSKSVIVKSIERNVANMYVARLHLLGMACDSQHIVIDNARLNSGCLNIGQSALNYVGCSVASINSANAPLLINGLGGSSLQHILSPTHWVQSPRPTTISPLYSPVLVMTPTPTYPLTNPVDMVVQNRAVQNDATPTTSVIHLPTDASVSINSLLPNLRNMSPDTAIQTSSRISNVAGPRTLESQSEFVPYIDHQVSPSNSGHTLDLLGLSKPIGEPLAVLNQSDLDSQRSFYSHRGIEHLQLALGIVLQHNANTDMNLVLHPHPQPNPG